MTYSVGMCTYNGAKYVAEQLNSILAQTVKPDEIIVSDDGSTDETLQIIETVLSGSGVPYHVYTDNEKHGVVGNFWHAFSKCTCDVIFSCDQDDVWLPEKAETILKVFEKHDDALLVFSNGTIVDAELNPLGDIWDNLDFSMRLLEDNDWEALLLARRIVAGTTMAFKKSLFDENDAVPDMLLHDGYLAIKAALLKGVYCCENQLILYRQHANNVVGLQHKSFIIRVHSYVSHFREMRNIRMGNLNGWRLLDSYFSTNDNPIARSFIDCNIAFWSDMVKAQNSHLFTRLHICRKHWKSGDYNKYYSGFRGYMRDCILTFLFWIEKKGE